MFTYFIMTSSQAAVLAIVQGTTEFLPISSSAHLALAPWLLGWADQGLEYDIALHVGTLAAVLLYFFRDWVQIVGQAFGFSWGNDPDLSRNPHLLWFLAAGTLPAAIAGVLLKDTVETSLRSPFVIAAMLLAVALLMWYAERTGSRRRALAGITLADALFIGTAQAIALVPGTSRSGITIVAALLRGFDRPSAARFSFLLSTPAIAGAALLAVHDLVKAGGITPSMRTPFLLGVVVSAVTGCLVIAFFLRFLRRFGLQFFVYYRLVFGIIVLALAILRRTAG